MILIVTRPDDAHALAMLPRLEQQGVSVARLSHALFPQRAELGLTFEDGNPLAYTVRIDGTTLELGTVSAVWYRRPELPVVHEYVDDPAVRRWTEIQCVEFLESAWNTHDALWFPATPSRIKAASAKAVQLKLARALGFEIPPTLITNSPSDALSFFERHDGKIIRKAVASADVFASDGSRARPFTYVVSARDLEHVQGLECCPTILQAYVEKHVELRITVVGTRVFAAEIDSQRANHSRYDWRHHDTAQTPHRPHDLPDVVRARCVELVSELGLLFGAIDMILTPDRRYVFLEINPNGEYLWIEHLAGLPISDAVCEALVAREKKKDQTEGAQ